MPTPTKSSLINLSDGKVMLIPMTAIQRLVKMLLLLLED